MVQGPDGHVISRVGPVAALGLAAGAVLCGAWSMRLAGVASARPLVNLGAAALGIAFCVFLAPRLRGALEDRAQLALWIAAGLAGLPWLVDFGGQAHRWIPVGPLSVHTGALAAPLVLFGIAHEAGERRRRVALLPLFLLAFQPDAGTTTALGCAVLALAVLGLNTGTVLVGASLGAVAFAWTRPAPTLRVPEVEDAFALAFRASPWLGALAVALVLGLVASCAAVGIARRGGGARSAIPAAVLLAVLFALPSLAAYPVPLVGYGASQVLGVFLVLGLAVPRERHARA
ncbi:MAG: hypothetical protein KC657_25095 [Myxococcales bacterium]|nr:hypothetical protein [Myxococcales bacterium]